MRTSLMIACRVGLIACVIAFLGLVLAPHAAEKHVRDAVIALLKQELVQRTGLTADQDTLLDQIQVHLKRKVEAERAELTGPVADLTAAVLARLCHYDCGRPAQIANSMRDGVRTRVERLEHASQRVRGWATSRYSGLVTQFVAELRIFTASNAILLLLALVGLTRAPLHRGIQTVAALVMVATFTTAYFYIARQNWLLTFVLADYVGWGYLVWVALVFSFLVDVTFLRGTITRGILSALSPPGGIG